MIIFRNIYTGEERQVSTEPHIAAFWGSGDRSPNVSQGQDRGWRLDPQVQVEMENIMADDSELDQIARKAKILTERMKESDVLVYLSERDDKEGLFEQSSEDFERKYQIDLNKVREEQEERNKLDEEFRKNKQAGRVTAPKAEPEEKKVEAKEPAGSKAQSDSVKIEDKSTDEGDKDPKADAKSNKE